ncbi:MAG: rhodanese-like domain-containing protein [Burkholderiaceae bacterium]
MQPIQPAQLAAWLATDASSTSPERPLLLDVREDWERQLARIEDSIHIPMNEIPARFEEVIDGDRPIVCYCHHGMRSMQVALFLERRGSRQAYNLVGGIDAWARTVDAGCARY